MIVAREDMAVDLKEIERVTADPKEFTVLIKDNSVTKPVAQLDFHDSGRKIFGIGVLDGFHRGKSGHATACNQVYLRTIRARMFPRRICIDEQNQERRFDWKVVH